MSYGILSKNVFVLGGYILGDFAIGDSVLDSIYTYAGLDTLILPYIIHAKDIFAF